MGAYRVPVRSAEVLVAVLVAGTTLALDRLFAANDCGSGRCWLRPPARDESPGNHLPTVTMHTSPAVEDALGNVRARTCPSDTLINVPFDCDPYFASYQLLHETDVVGCANQLAANPWRSKMTAYTSSDALTKLRCNKKEYGRIATTPRREEPFGAADVEELRREFGVRFLVIDRQRTPFCPTVAAAVQFLQQYERLGIDGKIEVIDLYAPRLGT